ncbi:MAG: carboxymuconolactone decarboxylase family protein [Planctomycetota bacterium]
MSRAEAVAAEVPGPPADSAEDNRMEPQADEEACCEEDHGSGAAAVSSPPGTPEAQQKFRDFMSSVNAPGALDAYTKRVVAIALSVLAKCEPCLKMHIKKAREMGLSEEEIDEAAWMGIAFGGSPAMMFYNTVRKQ